MAFPDDVLTDQEEVVLHLHPHWKTAVRPGLLVLLALAVTIVAWVMLPQNNGGRIGFGVVALIMLYYGIRYGVAPLVIWRCTHYVLTDERILLQDGVIARERRDLPLNRVNDHALTQSLLDRLLGSRHADRRLDRRPGRRARRGAARPARADGALRADRLPRRRTSRTTRKRSRRRRRRSRR